MTLLTNWKTSVPEHELWTVYRAYVKDNFPRVRIEEGGDHWRIYVHKDHFRLLDVRKNKWKQWSAADPASTEYLNRKLRRGHVTAVFDGDKYFDFDIIDSMQKTLMADIVLSIDQMIIDNICAVDQLHAANSKLGVSLGQIAESMKFLKAKAEAIGKPIITASQINIGL